MLKYIEIDVGAWLWPSAPTTLELGLQKRRVRVPIRVWAHLLDDPGPDEGQPSVYEFMYAGEWYTVSEDYVTVLSWSDWIWRR